MLFSSLIGVPVILGEYGIGTDCRGFTGKGAGFRYSGGGARRTLPVRGSRSVFSFLLFLIFVAPLPPSSAWSIPTGERQPARPQNFGIPGKDAFGRVPSRHNESETGIL